MISGLCREADGLIMTPVTCGYCVRPNCPEKRFDVPAIWEAALQMIRGELDRIMWNIHQEEYQSPFANTGNRFDECEEFTVEAYSWNEDHEQSFNFKWRDVEISWYKHLYRGLNANMELSADLASEMLGECLVSLRRYEREKDPLLSEISAEEIMD